MARFIGTEEEYVKFVGPRIRNRIQTLTKKERTKRNGICDHCGKKAELQSAHQHGNDRKTLIAEVLGEYKKGACFDVYLEECEEKIMESHKYIDKVFHFLCPECHKKYDNHEIEIKPKKQTKNAVKNKQTQEVSFVGNNSLSLSLLPDKNTFKKRLLISKKANWTISYADGRKENGVWNANNFTESSDITSNIRSGYLRNWKEKGIIEAVFEVMETDVN